MSTDTMWLILSVIVQVVVPILNPRGAMRGKFFTRPLRKWFPRVFNNGFCRLFQITIIFVVFETLRHGFGVPEHIAGPLYFLMVIILYLDDYFTDHDDYKKFGDAVRNKIKWKMKLTAPAPAGSKVG